jgi:23S rRNA (cytidine1920-2'-O)/16S rRNA (cytidine1409-2'-O)-methyltransferase
MSRGAAGRRTRVRLDELLVARGLAATRGEAARLILAGQVRLPGGPLAKAGRLVAADAPVERLAPARFVGRGGEKLAAALDAFGVSVEARVCLDIGASTGGFTDCLLTRGARRVHAVDVGHGQLHPRLRDDPRVAVWEGVNARHLEPRRFADDPSFATVDVSFIALEKVLPAVLRCLVDPAEVVALVKPQFEVGRHQVGKGGVVRAADARREAVRGVAAAAAALGLHPRGVAASVLHGPKGNREVFIYLARTGPRPPLEGAAFETALATAVPDDDPAAPSRRAPPGHSSRAEGRRPRTPRRARMPRVGREMTE